MDGGQLFEQRKRFCIFKRLRECSNHQPHLDWREGVGEQVEGGGGGAEGEGIQSRGIQSAKEEGRHTSQRNFAKPLSFPEILTGIFFCNFLILPRF